MRKSILVFWISMAVLVQAAWADTIHLKNGSVLKGKVSSFADDQFIIMLDTGSGRYMSKAMVYMGDVARIEFDSASGAISEAPTAAPEPTEPAPGLTKNETQPRNKKGGSNTSSEPLARAVQSVEAQPKETQPKETQPKETGPPETSPPPVVDASSEKPVATNPAPVPVSNPPDASDTAERASRKPIVPIRTMNVDVGAKKDWTSSGLIVKRGDHIRITASGSITLDPVSGRTCGPEGVGDLADPKKLMPDQPTGALIGVISSDNDDFIFIGRSGEFTATRDGLLFLSVNEGQLSDNIGSFKATVEVLSQRR